jgi:hypothetical protein
MPGGVRGEDVHRSRVCNMNGRDRQRVAVSRAAPGGVTG